MSTALVFPGQGSQTVGMGYSLYQNFPIARAVFDEVDAVLGESLSRLIWEGPEAELTQTTNAQPALMTTSIAALRVLEQEAGLNIARHIAYVAGHSLGEYTALCAAGALTLADTARLLRLRGQAMQAAGQGSMAAILGLDFAQVAVIAQKAAQETQAVCQAANDNGGGQVVISGHTQAVEHALALAREAGAKRAIPLAVSAPFHCKLMQPAAEIMAKALAQTPIRAPKVPLIANVTALPVQEASPIRDHLVRQVTGTVRWRESVLFMNAQGVETFIEIGAGQVLTGLIKRILVKSNTKNVGKNTDIDSFKAHIDSFDAQNTPKGDPKCSI